jgi:hypothetical protein
MRLRSIAMASAAGLVLTGVVGAAQTAIPAGNLIKNPGGESNQGGVNILQNVSPSGWVTSGGEGDKGISVLRYGAHGYFPDKAFAASIGGGKSFFAGGYNAPTSTATQTINVSSAAAEIDARGVRACLSAYLGGVRNFTENARVDLAFLGADENELGQLRIGPVTAGQRKNATTMLRRTAERVVPANTRQLSVVITAVKGGPGPNYGYADNVVVGLTQRSCEPVLMVKCKGRALVAEVTPSSVAKTQRVRFAVKGGKRTKQAADARAPFTSRFTMDGLTGRLTVTATVTQKESGPIVLTKKSKRC